MSGNRREKDPPLIFSAVTSENFGTSPENLVTFNINLLSHCKILIPTTIDKIYTRQTLVFM